VPVSDSVGWLPDDIVDYVSLYEDEAGSAEAVKLARSESDARRGQRLELARDIRRRHVFEARARSIPDVVASLDSDPDKVKSA